MHFDKQNNLLSQIIISNIVLEEVNELKIDLKKQRFTSFYYEIFLLEHVKDIIKEAYIAEENIKYIIIASLNFSNVVQNSLLKLLEEPPKNIRFILISPTKSILLPTILSRLPIYKAKNRLVNSINIDLSFKQFNLNSMSSFMKTHEKISKKEAKEIVQQMFIKATQELKQLNSMQLHAFEQALPLLELNARPLTIFTNILLNFLPEDKYENL